MKKVWMLLITLMVTMLMVSEPATALDLSKPLGLGDEKTLALDVELKAARPFDAEYSVENDVENLNITATEHEWFLNAKIGIKIADLVRPYIELETVTNIYAQRAYGCEVLVPISGVDVGVWAAYINRTNFKVSQDKYGMAGIVARF